MGISSPKNLTKKKEDRQFFYNCPRNMNEYRPKQIKKELREKAGLTRRDLADKIGCREHTIFRWENGENKKPLSPYRKELENFYKEMLTK